MYRVIGWIAAGIGTLLVLYAAIMVLVGTLLVPDDQAGYFHERLDVGIAIAHNIGIVGGVLLTTAAFLIFATNRIAKP